MSWADWRVLSGNMGKDADGKFGWGTVAKDWCTRDDPPGIFGDSEDESSSAKTAKEKYQDVSNNTADFWTDLRKPISQMVKHAHAWFRGEGPC